MATGEGLGLPSQLKQRRFHALRNHSVKLFKINQGKVLKVLRRDHPGEFDDVRSGVCAALSCVWLKSMMGFSAQSLLLQELNPSENAPQLFLGLPTNLEMAEYLTDAEVVTLHRKYKNSGRVVGRELKSKVEDDKSKATPVEIERYNLLGFWIEAFQEIGMRLDRYWFPVSRPRVTPPQRDAPFATRMAWMVMEAGLDRTSPEPGIGAYIGFDLRITSVKGRSTVLPRERNFTDDFELDRSHAVALFRHGGNANGPLFFMDPNCGVYRVHPGQLLPFLQEWVKGYEDSVYMTRHPTQYISHMVSKVETRWSLTKISECFVGLALQPPPIARKPE